MHFFRVKYGNGMFAAFDYIFNAISEGVLTFFYDNKHIHAGINTTVLK